MKALIFMNDSVTNRVAQVLVNKYYDNNTITIISDETITVEDVLNNIHENGHYELIVIGIPVENSDIFNLVNNAGVPVTIISTNVSYLDYLVDQVDNDKYNGLIMTAYSEAEAVFRFYFSPDLPETIAMLTVNGEPTNEQLAYFYYLNNYIDEKGHVPDWVTETDRFKINTVNLKQAIEEGSHSIV